MNFKKITSLTALISFILEILTSIILYIVPQGRVAYWADWHLWGLSKNQWTELHINLGVLFLIAIIFHTWYNWPIISSYLKDKGRQLKIFTFSFNIALLLAILFCLGTYFAVPPFSTIIRLSESFKNQAAVTYGEPPYGHAELSSLASFTKKTDLDLEQSLRRLKAAGITINNNEQTLASIAKTYRLTPKQLYEIMQPPTATTSGPGLPSNAPSGLGHLSLAELCRKYQLDLDLVQQFLLKNGLSSKGDSSLKEIGAANDRNPHDIYDLIAEQFRSDQ